MHQSKVMISSTVIDLPDHRDKTKDAILRAEMSPLMMQLKASSPTDAIEFSLQLVEKAEIYIGIFGHRYGHIPDDPIKNPNKLSVTELEYRRALERNIPILIYIMSPDHLLKVGDIDTDAEKLSKIKKLKDELTSKYVVSFFSSSQELGFRVFQSLIELPNLDLSQPLSSSSGSGNLALPLPPQLFSPHRYLLTRKFFGRHDELHFLDKWAKSKDTTIVIDAIGGIGKSALTWEWVQSHANQQMPDLTGIIWWSFYESDATVSNFTRHALAYITLQKSVEAVDHISPYERSRILLDLLKQKQYLLILDGLERILVAYHRMNAPQLTDDYVDQEVTEGLNIRSCTDPRDGEFLRLLTNCSPSKILISTRLYPLELQIDRNNPKPTIQVFHYILRGIYPPAEALALLHHLGVQGNSKSIMDFTRQFDNHALLLNVIAGLVINFRPAPGDFDAWYESEGRRLNLHKLDMKQRRTNILHAALTGLAPEVLKLLSRIAAFRYSVDYRAVSVLNPFEPLRPKLPELSNELITALKTPEKPTTPTINSNSDDQTLRRYRLFLKRLGATSTQEQRLDLKTKFLTTELAFSANNTELRKLVIDFSKQLDTYYESMSKYLNDHKAAQINFNEALSDLENRGLLHWDRESNRYDLHPVVRGYAFELLEANDKRKTFEQIGNYFESLPPEDLDTVREVGDIRCSLEIYNALIGSQQFNKAADYYDNRLKYMLIGRLAAYTLAIELLTPFFSQGFDTFPTELASKQQDNVIKDLAVAFYYVGRTKDAARLQTLLLEKNIKNKDPNKLVTSLINLSMTLRADSQLAITLRLRELAHEIAVATKDIYEQMDTDFYLLRVYSDIGNWDLMDEIYRKFTETSSPYYRLYEGYIRKNFMAGVKRYYGEGLLFQNNENASVILKQALDLAVEFNEPLEIRETQHMLGETALKAKRLKDAANHIQSAITLGQKQGSAQLPNFWSGLAKVRVQQKRKKEAGKLIEEALAYENPIEVHRLYNDVAEVYLALGQEDKATEYAIKAYEVSWADGPPHCWKWALERAKRTLSLLGMTNEELIQKQLGLENAKHLSVPHEEGILAFIEEIMPKEIHNDSEEN